MIRLLHGDNIAASRNALYLYKSNAVSPTSLRGGEFTLTDLVQIFEGGQLFSESKNIFIDDFFGRIKKGPELQAYAEYLSIQANQHTIVIWESKVLTKTQLALFKSTSTELFKLPTTLFTFLDSIKPSAAKSILPLAQKAASDAGEEMVYAMLIRHIRLLLAILANAEIEEAKRLAPWQKIKLQKQASLFSEKQLLSLFEKLLLIDKERKTGNNAQSLSASIDFFLLQI